MVLISLKQKATTSLACYFYFDKTPKGKVEKLKYIYKKWSPAHIDYEMDFKINLYFSLLKMFDT